MLLHASEVLEVGIEAALRLHTLIAPRFGPVNKSIYIIRVRHPSSNSGEAVAGEAVAPHRRSFVQEGAVKAPKAEWQVGQHGRISA